MIVYLPGVRRDRLLPPSPTPLWPLLLFPAAHCSFPLSGTQVTATILGAVLMEIRWLGRKYAMAFAAALMGTSLFLYATVSSYAAFVGLNLFEYWAQSCELIIHRPLLLLSPETH